MKWRSRRYKVGFKVYFDSIVWISSKQQYCIVATTITKLVLKPLCASTQVRPSGNDLIQTIKLWLFSEPFPFECVYSGLLMDFIMDF
jgi:hypothetical protein